MAIAIMGFVFPHAMQSVLEEQFTDKIIHTYREDVDLQNLIDFAQQEVRSFTFKKITLKLISFCIDHFTD
jgi:ribosome-binding ATPase YchF (GTP1/OBG family)